MYSDILFGARHFDLLREVFGDREYEISSDTSARRVGRVREPPHWLPPLGPHLDAFVHPPRFTVNFWIPFQECGIDAPGLGVVQAPFADVLGRLPVTRTARRCGTIRRREAVTRASGRR